MCQFRLTKQYNSVHSLTLFLFCLCGLRGSAEAAGASITAVNGVIMSEAAPASVASLMFLALASAEVVVIATTRIRSEKPTCTEVARTIGGGHIMETRKYKDIRISGISIILMLMLIISSK